MTARRRKDNRWLVIDGERKTLSQWCQEYGRRTTTVFERLERGWDAERAVTQPVRRYRDNQEQELVIDGFGQANES